MKYLYLEKPAYDSETETISPEYKIEEGTFVAGWKVEKKPDEDGYTPTPEEQPDGAHTLRDRVTELEKQNQMLIQCLLEMSQIVYA